MDTQAKFSPPLPRTIEMKPTFKRRLAFAAIAAAGMAAHAADWSDTSIG